MISQEFWQKCQEERDDYSKHLPPSTDIARKWLKWLNSSHGFTWQNLSEILGVPVGTLHGFANGRKLPHKYKKKLGIYYDRILDDMPKRELRWAIEHREDY